MYTGDQWSLWEGFTVLSVALQRFHHLENEGGSDFFPRPGLQMNVSVYKEIAVKTGLNT